MTQETRIPPIGLRIAQKRLAAGLSQTELAERVGIAQQSLSRIESCRHVPTLTTVIVLANALKVSVAELLRK